MEPAREPTPRWVKVFAIIALVVVVLFVVLLLTGRGGEHGPGRHAVPSELAERG
jgi:ABC-type transporter Mla subunit MlaD